MASPSNAKYSFSLDSVGCFRFELSVACDEKSAAPLRRWHGQQVKAGRLLEKRDFVYVRRTLDEQRHDDEVFYFDRAIELCQRSRSTKFMNVIRVNRKTLREHGFLLIDGQVVLRNQLNLFCVNPPFLQEKHTNNATELNSFRASLKIHRYNGLKIPQRRADGYINANALCKAIGRDWASLELQLASVIERLGISMGTSVKFLVQKFYRKANEQEIWIHPRLATDVANAVSNELVDAVRGWNNSFIGGFEELPASTDDLEGLSKSVELLLEEVKVSRTQITSRIDGALDKLITQINVESLNNKRSSFLDTLNLKIETQRTHVPIQKPLKYWKSFRCRPTQSTYINYPYVYVIILYSPPNSYEEPTVFYVGQSTVQLYQRFSNHDGLKSVEKLQIYGYSYEVFYHELDQFSIQRVLNAAEDGLRLALEPYWESLNPKQRSLAKQGSLLTEGLMPRLYPRESLPKIS